MYKGRYSYLVPLPTLRRSNSVIVLRKVRILLCRQSENCYFVCMCVCVCGGGGGDIYIYIYVWGVGGVGGSWDKTGNYGFWIGV